MLLCAIVGTNGAQVPWGCACGSNSFHGTNGRSFSASCSTTADYCTTTCTGSGSSTLYDGFTTGGCVACCFYCCTPPPPACPAPAAPAAVAHASGAAPASCSCVHIDYFNSAGFDAGGHDSSYADASHTRGTADAYGSDPCPLNNDRCGRCDAAYAAAFPGRADDANIHAYVDCCNYCCVPGAPSAHSRRRGYGPAKFSRRRYDSDSFEK
jgi:hypothetical protein